MALPQRQQTLEKGAVFVAQWCQPNVEVSWKNIATKLDALSEKVFCLIVTVLLATLIYFVYNR